MKSLFLLLIVALVSPLGLSDEGGVGGFSGASHDYTKYGKLRNGVGIWFQDKSTFVNPVYNKTLCLNKRKDQFQAVVNNRKSPEERRRLRKKPDRGRPKRVQIYQNRVSMKEVCADNRCRDMEWTPYVQKQVQWGEFSKSDRGSVKRVKVIIPNCR